MSFVAYADSLCYQAPWFADDPLDTKNKVLHDRVEIKEGEMAHDVEDFLRKVNRCTSCFYDYGLPSTITTDAQEATLQTPPQRARHGVPPIFFKHVNLSPLLSLVRSLTYSVIHSVTGISSPNMPFPSRLTGSLCCSLRR
jgi:hypothetical protein